MKTVFSVKREFKDRKRTVYDTGCIKTFRSSLFLGYPFLKKYFTDEEKVSKKTSKAERIFHWGCGCGVNNEWLAKFNQVFHHRY